MNFCSGNINRNPVQASLQQPFSPVETDQYRYHERFPAQVPASEDVNGKPKESWQWSELRYEPQLAESEGSLRLRVIPKGHLRGASGEWRVHGSIRRGAMGLLGHERATISSKGSAEPSRPLHFPIFPRESASLYPPTAIRTSCRRGFIRKPERTHETFRHL